MNIYTFSGHIGADPVLRYTPNQKAVCSFSVGVSSGYGDKRTTIWVRCQLWEKQADLANEAFKKGMKFSGSGEITSTSYEKDGSQVPQLEVRVSSFDLPPKGESSSIPEDRPERNQENPTYKPSNSSVGFDDFDSDIPFMNPYKFNWRVL